MKIQAHAMTMVLALTAVTLALTPGQLTGQSTAKPIFLALPDVFPDVDARLVLLREPGREVVLLDPAAATADELGAGLRLLARLRRERGEPLANRGQMIPIVGFARGPSLTPLERARLEAVIEELRARPIANVGNLGRGRWMRYDATP